MRPVAPRTGHDEVTYAEDQEAYQPITVAVRPYADCVGLITRWKPTDAERAAIARGEDLYIEQLSFNNRMTPLTVRCGPGDWQVGGAGEATP